MLSAVAENFSGTCLPRLRSSRLLHSAFAARRSLDAKPGTRVLAGRRAIERSWLMSNSSRFADQPVRYSAAINAQQVMALQTGLHLPSPLMLWTAKVVCSLSVSIDLI